MFCFVLTSTGAHEEIDYSAKLKFSDDEGEEEVEEERAESVNDSRYVVKPVCVLWKDNVFSQM